MAFVVVADCFVLERITEVIVGVRLHSTFCDIVSCPPPPRARATSFVVVLLGCVQQTDTKYLATKFASGEEKERVLVQMFEGHYFGEVALIYGEPRNASVRATGEVGTLYSSITA